MKNMVSYGLHRWVMSFFPFPNPHMFHWLKEHKSHQHSPTSGTPQQLRNQLEVSSFNLRGETKMVGLKKKRKKILWNISKMSKTTMSV